MLTFYICIGFILFNMKQKCYHFRYLPSGRSNNKTGIMQGILKVLRSHAKNMDHIYRSLCVCVCVTAEFVSQNLCKDYNIISKKFSFESFQDMIKFEEQCCRPHHWV